MRLYSYIQGLREIKSPIMRKVRQVYADEDLQVLSYLKFWLTDWKVWAFLFINLIFLVFMLVVHQRVFVCEFRCETDKSPSVCMPLCVRVGVLAHASTSIFEFVCLRMCVLQCPDEVSFPTHVICNPVRLFIQYLLYISRHNGLHIHVSGRLDACIPFLQ